MIWSDRIMLNIYRSENTVAFIKTNTFRVHSRYSKVCVSAQCDATNSKFANMCKVQREETMRAKQKIHKQTAAPKHQSVVFWPSSLPISQPKILTDNTSVRSARKVMWHTVSHLISITHTASCTHCPRTYAQDYCVALFKATGGRFLWL